jgi:hypothetical protein
VTLSGWRLKKKTNQASRKQAMDIHDEAWQFSGPQMEFWVGKAAKPYGTTHIWMLIEPKSPTSSNPEQPPPEHSSTIIELPVHVVYGIHLA